MGLDSGRHAAYSDAGRVAARTFIDNQPPAFLLPAAILRGKGAGARLARSR